MVEKLNASYVGAERGRAALSDGGKRSNGGDSRETVYRTVGAQSSLSSGGGGLRGSGGGDFILTGQSVSTLADLTCFPGVA